MDLSRRQILIYVAIAIVVAAVGIRYLLAHGGGDSGAGGVSLAAAGSATLSPSGSPLPSESSSADPGVVVVYVCGEVRRPGVYRLTGGARVADALELAGGATAGAELDVINLAAPLTDGQQVVVPEAGAAVAAPASGAASTPPAGGASAGSAASAGATAPVNLNTATLEQLDTLPGVGPSTAQKIVDYRSANGGFKSVDDLKDVSGIGDVRFEALKDLVTI